MNNRIKSQNKVREVGVESLPHNVLEHSSNNVISAIVKNIFKISTPLTLEPSQPSRIHTIMLRRRRKVEEHNKIN